MSMDQDYREACHQQDMRAARFQISTLRARIDKLEVALAAMLNTHGKPHREEWLNDAAYEHAKAVDAEARAALTAGK